MCRMALGLVTLLLAGCALSSLDGFPLPAEARRPDVTFAVHHQPEDQHRLDKMIVDALRGRGLNAVPADSEDAEFTVSYVDRWYWDMRLYLIDLRIDVREANTDVLVATARSYQSSLSAMGETHRSVVEQTVDVLVEGMDERLREREERRKQRKRRRPK